MLRIIILLGILMGGLLREAHAQTACTPQSQAANLAALADGLAPGSITPRVIRNLTCSVTPPILYCANFVSIQACHDALPSTGGSLILPDNTTFVVTSTITISKPNVVVACPSWSTIIQRGPSLATNVLTMTGAGDSIQDCTIDGTATASSSTDLCLCGASQLAFHVQALNGAGNIQVALSGQNDRLAYSTVTGRGGISNQTYGVWANGHVTVEIDHNTISNAGIDGIGFDGIGSEVKDNHLFNNHCYTGVGGGQIVLYSGATSNSAIISGNTIDTGCSDLSIGIEVDGNDITISGNVINKQNAFGIIVDSGAVRGILVSGNTILNSCQIYNISQCGAFVGNSGNTHVSLVGNKFIDDQVTATQQTGISSFGTFDHMNVTDNEITGNILAPITAGIMGANTIIKNNLGIDNIIPTVASAAALPFPYNPTISMSGTTGVTSITGAAWTNREVTILPVGVVAFTAGNNIANSFTTVAKVPVVATYDGTLWHLK